MHNIHVGIHLVKNLGNYNSLRLEYSLDEDLQNGEDVQDVTDRLWAQVEAELERKVAEYETE